jgi:hypothetical protein
VFICTCSQDISQATPASAGGGTPDIKTRSSCAPVVLLTYGGNNFLRGLQSMKQSSNSCNLGLSCTEQLSMVKGECSAGAGGCMAFVNAAVSGLCQALGQGTLGYQCHCCARSSSLPSTSFSSWPCVHMCQYPCALRVFTSFKLKLEVPGRPPFAVPVMVTLQLQLPCWHAKQTWLHSLSAKVLPTPCMLPKSGLIQHPVANTVRSHLCLRGLRLDWTAGMWDTGCLDHMCLLPRAATDTLETSA